MSRKEILKYFNFYDYEYNKEECVSDSLMIGVDFSPNDEGVLVVMRRVEDDMYILNQFRNEEARELYNKLIGIK